ncbi:MAG: putative lipid II flippase FtsW [Clostridium sp. 28_12]|jgi:cell division protein FtsW|nr:MAG: putative lipid II flippase FtsW [Clostridium sp. 28_12]
MAKKKNKMEGFSKFLNNSVDFTLVITVLLLLSLGLVMVLSASSPTALQKYDKSYYFFVRQLIFAVLGLFGMYFISKIDYRIYQKFYKHAWILSIILLISVFAFGSDSHGAKRWIYITKSLSFQPSEIVKFLIIIFYGGILVKDRDDLGKFWKGLVKHILFLVPIIALLLLEPHVSTSMVIIITCCIMMIMAGCKFWQFLVSGIVAVGGIGSIATVLYMASAKFQEKFQYIVTRFITFTDPWKDATGDGWQIIQSLYAIGSGGLFGAGLGESKQKYLYLSEPHNDFIFSIIAEELGFVGCILVFVLFAVFIWRGVLIAMKAPDMFGSLVAVGITSLVGVQAIINVAVVTSSMPVTGMQLPFFSYGGTALFILLCEVGVLLSISRAGNK